MCKVKQAAPKEQKAPEAAPTPQPTASSVSTPTLDLKVSNQKRGKRSLSLRRSSMEQSTGPTASTGVATGSKSGLGTPA